MILYHCLHIVYLNKTLEMEALKCPLRVLPVTAVQTHFRKVKGLRCETCPSCSGHGEHSWVVWGSHISTTLKKAPPWPGVCKAQENRRLLQENQRELRANTSEQLYRETRQGLKLPAVRGHLSSAFCFKTIPGGTCGVFSTFLCSPRRGENCGLVKCE